MEQPRYTWLRQLLKDVSGVYVEVGTCWGGLADFLCRETPVNKLLCVDPYRKFPAEEYQDTLNTESQENLDKKYLAVWSRLHDSFRGKAEIVRTTSTAAAGCFANNCLSFVYIDGNHAFDHVVEDIVSWIVKVRPGGIIAGDDVEDLALFHTDGNAKIVHEGGASSLCGVHMALEHIKKSNPWFDYQLEGNQWWWRRPVE